MNSQEREALKNQFVMAAMNAIIISEGIEDDANAIYDLTEKAHKIAIAMIKKRHIPYIELPPSNKKKEPIIVKP